ncbi:hypothetical protein PR202_gb03486 [Eleusine coracana subsp. coracana]|uniref:4-hydroxy-7-methoxy-3-oxo-3,4-dihydro-2H-1,4-benzoxazin-2-yl glucosidebeta-D-glucosidase n=1 Tax=Eleusine coracana subsp. coracana TaxID=191504 RepID=A0AAV5E243_ELECO|nr:hypothetical protein PR202_gb03486 [Eleusine coracana subsp. coracana]
MCNRRISNQLGLGIQSNEAPSSLQKLLYYLKLKYRNPPVVIYENGELLYYKLKIRVGDKPDPSRRFVTDDEFRTHYLQGYIEATLLSIRNGSNVQGYFVWSFMDVFELLFAYRFRFGLYGVDFGAEEKRRYPRHSAQWYASFLHGSELRPATPTLSRIRAYSER